ncbi:MAG: sigma-54 dependent transcriptional regulator [Holosporales bacterium]|jgi:two-component system nitrogen regulation response regulator NtrX|nr:sigma-54 dependent transcriptional regulator [Holosporales bacterium]
MQRQEVLVVDDEQEVRALISDVLRDEGYVVKQANDGLSAMNTLKSFLPSVVLLDLWIGTDESAGIEILQKIKEKSPHLPVIMISGHGTIDAAVEATRRGAYDFIEKPFVIDKLLLAVKRAAESCLLVEENLKLRKRIGRDNQLIGKSGDISQIKQMIKKVAGTNSRVLVTGPIGVEVEAVAFEVHNCSPRQDLPFVSFNCANVDSGAFEKELFGEENLNGEIAAHGALDAVGEGTLFLEEVTDLSAELQSKLVRALQENAYKRVGGRQALDIKARLISSTSSNIEELINQGKFRRDLYYRLGVVPIKVPPIKDRREDIEQLVNFYLDNANDFFSLPPKKISKEALALLVSYNWPGNVRQLRNVIEWTLIMSGGADEEEISIESLPPEIKSPKHAVFDESVNMDRFVNLPLREAREMFEYDYLLMQVNRFLGNVSKTASFIGMERSALHRKLRSMDLTREKRRLDDGVDIEN